MKRTAPWIGLLAAIAVTTTMDATGLTLYSALPLLPLAVLGWLLLRLSRREMGLGFGRAAHYGRAVAYPLTVLPAAALLAWAFGGVGQIAPDWRSVGLNVLAGCVIGPLMVLLTEEGFFRGWLWGALRRSGRGPAATLWITSLGFMLWHVSAISLTREFALSGGRIPVYLVNAALLGLIWGMLRMASGSAWAPAVSHAVWNALAYAFFGFGPENGALNLTDTFLFGPEAGLAGLVLNGSFAWWLWRRVRRAEG